MERAIKDLCRLPDTKLFDEVSEGVGYIVEAVTGLDETAQHLSATDRTHAATIVGNQAQEEAAKILILIDAVRCPRNRSKDKARTLGYFYDHVAKGIYGDVCDWRPVDLSEVAEGVDLLREEHYLDGPNDIDWIFPNRITQRREDDLYVGYVRDDSEEAGQGDCSWSVPRYKGLRDLLGYRTASIVNIAKALHAVGATSAAGLAAIADLWRPVEVTPAMACEELAAMNWRTLETLEERGLLASVAPEVYGLIRNRWPFPLWPLDLTLRRIDKEKLREARRRWVPDF